MRNKLNLIITYTIVTLTSLSANAYVNKDFASQRSLFLQVESDLKKGKLASYQKHKHDLINYALYPYLRYELLKGAINNIKHADVSAFVKTYHDSPLASKLRNEWLRNRASKKLWADYLIAYEPSSNNDIELQCHYINASLQVNNDKSIYKHVPEIWLQGKVLPGACDPVFAAWKKDGHLTRNLLWQRIKLAIKNNEIALARHLAKDLAPADSKMVELWIRANHDPQIITKDHYFSEKHAANIEIIMHALLKIAKTKPDQAAILWKQLETKHRFSEDNWGLLIKEVGLSLARKQAPNAKEWLDTIPNKLIGKDVSDARLKLAVSKNDWSSIAQAYLTLPEEESHTEKWQYWYARALEMLGHRESSQEILNSIAPNRGYYGFLASARILRPFAFNHEANNIPSETLNKILLNPAVIRAHELKQIGRTHVGKTEWTKALQNFSEQEKLAAAHLANEWQMPNWAIVALSKCKNKNDLILRFPQNFADHFHREAVNNDLDPEVLFAITRQESAFIPTAKSPVGALGLMQLMPNTAKMLAKQSREPLRHHNELLSPEKNIRFGSKYLRMMLNQNQQNHALAAASYNAGPHRVSNWLPEYDMPADMWIETIPFKETREYVQNFLTYVVIYQRLLGKTPKLNKYMPVINGVRRKIKTTDARIMPIKTIKRIKTTISKAKSQISKKQKIKTNKKQKKLVKDKRGKKSNGA